MRRTQNQKGAMQAVTRKSGQQVWVYRWFEPNQTGRPKRIKRVIGSLAKLTKEKDAWDEVERLGLGHSFDQFGPRKLKDRRTTTRKRNFPKNKTMMDWPTARRTPIASIFGNGSFPVGDLAENAEADRGRGRRCSASRSRTRDKKENLRSDARAF